MKKQPCERCGLLYDHKKEERCPYCGELDQEGLKQLLARRAVAHQANRRLGLRFLLAAAFILIITLVFATW
ncbi:MAG: hypothetical protein ACQETD_03080 [Pseudomonadota bacterium]